MAEAEGLDWEAYAAQFDVMGGICEQWLEGEGKRSPSVQLRINPLGEVIGINTAIFSESGGSHGIGFAIPIQLAKEVMRQIIEHGHVIRGWLGITGQDLTPVLAESLDMEFRNGVLISGVLDDGPADRAGLRPGDLITEIDRLAIGGSPKMLQMIAARPPGSPLTITLIRDGRELQQIAIVGERPSISAR